MSAAWVIVVLLAGGQPPEIVTGTFPTKSACENWRLNVIENSHPDGYNWSLRCVLRKPNMRNHEIYFTGAEDD